MKVLKLTSENFKEVLEQALKTLQTGGTVAYPTDTSYGLGCDALKLQAIKKVYRIKERDLQKQPMHVLIPSMKWVKQNVLWNKEAAKLAKEFWPGPLSIAVPLKSNTESLKLISSNNFLGLRSPQNGFAEQLAKKFGKPITATSCNPSARLSQGFDPYSPEDILLQFKNRKYKPDLVVDAGKLKKNKPSTFIKIAGKDFELIRKGPISKKKITLALQ